jgi:hypothetical protein
MFDLASKIRLLVRAIFVFIVVFPDRGLAARPHRLFDL